MKNSKKMILILVGALAIVLAIVCFSMEAGFYESYYSYGGDAYTGIQNAAAQTANNVLKLAKIAKFGFGSILLIAGCGFIVAGISEEKAAKGNKEETPSEKNAAVEASTDTATANADESGDNLPEI